MALKRKSRTRKGNSPRKKKSAVAIITFVMAAARKAIEPMNIKGTLTKENLGEDPRRRSLLSRFGNSHF